MTDLIDAFHQVFGVPTYRLPRDTSPAAFEDEDALRRSRLSRRAAAEHRTGRYFPTVDADGLDRDGWAVGAEYPRRSA